MPANWGVESGEEASAYSVQEVGLAWRRERHTLLGGAVKKCKSMAAS